ncbi:unannotated protein [freshwater metagenome]|uniref:Unannotated protein n=1 Tax=freshwater metagenome TaxID=449393 RepID=A0A6J6RKH7_9ZZZZ
MTADSSIQPVSDPHALAAEARSILSCPRGVSLVVDGCEHLLEHEHIGMQDLGGLPTFSCLPGSTLAAAGADRRGALVTIESGLPRQAADGTTTVTVSGRLSTRGVEHCDCCDEERHVVVLEPGYVVLTRTADTRPRQLRVPLELFRSPAHHLNRGYLQRSVEHANDCHQDELRQALSRSTGTRPDLVIAVQLADLTPSGVQLSWVDHSGAHRTRIAFPRPARSTAELGEMLRRELHAGIC